MNGIAYVTEDINLQRFTSIQDDPKQASLSLASGERITQIAVQRGALIDRLEISTNLGNVLAAGGTGGQRLEVSSLSFSVARENRANLSHVRRCPCLKGTHWLVSSVDWVVICTILESSRAQIVYNFQYQWHCSSPLTD